MNKNDIIHAVAEQSGLSKANAARAVDALLEAISVELVKGGSVQLIGFGTFAVQQRAARTGRNPKTGAELAIPAHAAPVFKPGQKLKEAVQG